MPITHELSAILFAVIGSTGTQGGSVIQAIKASSKPYRVRAITRDPLKPAAKELEKLGCEVFAADVDDISTLKAAFQDAHYAFAMTALFRVRSQGKGKAQIDTAKAAGVALIVFSGLTNMTDATGGKIKVDVFDVKAEVVAYARSLGGIEVIDIQAGAHASNTLYMPAFQPKKESEGTYTLALALDADSPYASIDTLSDYGRYVIGAIESEIRPKAVYASDEYTTPAKMAEEMSRVSGKKVNFYRLPDEVLFKGLNAFNPTLANNIVPMMQSFQAVGYYNGKDLSESNKLLSSPAVSFGQYLDANKETLLKLLE
ncbi:MAG: hypothetical protein CYPHOPRED_000380 [Cyphobasidiales sp. Tagirdzhanova-0007]|nr:MAG: hypothetical protein CYPHOPRED_000380 [Cyphobasidiales sp. Tagirdzhanova-0007]